MNLKFCRRNKKSVEIDTVLGEKFQRDVAHEIDGLVFQPIEDPYMSGRTPTVLKWKPPELNSVDFKMLITKEQKEGMLREWKGYLYVLGFDQPVGFLKITKEIRQYDKKIVECTFQNGQWKFLRERTDKSFPNAYATYVGVCKSITEPIKKDWLIEFTKTKAKKTGVPQQKQPNSGKRPNPDSEEVLKRPKLDEPQTSEKLNNSELPVMPPPAFIPPQRSH